MAPALRCLAEMHRGRSPTVLIAFTVALWGCRSRAPVGRVVTLTNVSTSSSDRLSAQNGDVVLHGGDGSVLAFAAAPDRDAHRPIRGAIIDVTTEPPTPNQHDPVVWWRPAWFDANGDAHPLVATVVIARSCGSHGAGVHVSGSVDGVVLESDVCARDGNGGYDFAMRAVSGLPANARLGHEISAGNADVAVQRAGHRWTGEVQSQFVLVHATGVSIGIESHDPMVVRHDDFPSIDELTKLILYVRSPPGPVAQQRVYVTAGDAFAGLERLAESTRTVLVRGRARSFDLLDSNQEPILDGDLPATGIRSFRLPSDFGTSVLFRDERGVSGSAPRATRRYGHRAGHRERGRSA